MGKAAELIDKITENFQESILTEEAVEAAMNEELSLLTEAEIEAEVLEPLEGINEAKSTFPKAKQIKSMQALLKKLKKEVAPLKDQDFKLGLQKGRFTKKKGDKPLKPDAEKARKRQYKKINASQKKIRADIAKKQAIIHRAEAQLKRLKDERKEYTKKNRAAKKKQA